MDQGSQGEPSHSSQQADFRSEGGQEEMTDVQDESEAYAKLVDAVQPDSEPTLDPRELEDVLNRNKRGSRWVTNTDVNIGDALYPTVRNGHLYVVNKAGNTGATEPTWGTSMGGITTVGTATVLEYGVDSASVFNLRGAIRDAWNLKLAKASEYNEGDEKAVYDHIKEQCDRYALVTVS